MRKIFSVAMLIVGTVIGAGFCSGREIVSFFGCNASVFVAPVCGVLIFLACMLFLRVGSVTDRKNFDAVNYELLGKKHAAADVFLLFNNLIVLSAMIAGLNSLLAGFGAPPIFGSAAAALCGVIAVRGVKGLLDCNFFVVPLIIAVLVAACASALGDGTLAGSMGEFRISTAPVALIYVSMNMMLACTVLTTLGKLNRREIIWGSAIASVCVSLLLALIITAVNSTGSHEAEMPLLAVAAQNRYLYVALGVVTAISIFTTMLTAVGGVLGYMKGKAGGSAFNVAIVTAVGSALSFLGFGRVVSLLYPLIGAVGMAYTVVCIVYVVRRRSFNGRGALELSRRK